MTTEEQLKPSAWEMELDRFKSIKTTFILEGNIFDLHAYSMEIEGEKKVDDLPFGSLSLSISDTPGFMETVIYYNHVDGFYNEYSDAHVKSFAALAKGRERKPEGNGVNTPPQYTQEPIEKGDQVHQKTLRATIGKATEMIREAMETSSHPVAVILNLSSRYVSSPQELNDEERLFYSQLFLTTQKRKQHRVERYWQTLEQSTILY